MKYRERGNRRGSKENKNTKTLQRLPPQKAKRSGCTQSQNKKELAGKTRLCYCTVVISVWNTHKQLKRKRPMRAGHKAEHHGLSGSFRTRSKPPSRRVDKPRAKNTVRKHTKKVLKNTSSSFAPQHKRHLTKGLTANCHGYTQQTERKTEQATKGWLNGNT